MDIVMRVHRVSTHPVQVEVEYAGASAMAMLPELEVELMSEHGQHGSQTLHFRSASDIAEAKEMFVQGGAVTMTYAPGRPATTGPRMAARAAAEADGEAQA